MTIKSKIALSNVMMVLLPLFFYGGCDLCMPEYFIGKLLAYSGIYV